MAVDLPADYALWHGLSPMTDFFRDADPGLFLVSGEGSHVTDAAGRRYLDARSSMWNLALGHSCVPVKEAMHRQLDTLPSGTVMRYENPPVVAVEYAARLAALLPAPLRHVRFGNTGSQMTEAAVMLSRFHRRMTGQPDRCHVVAVHDGYHGTGPLATALTGEPILHEWSAPLDAHVRHAPPSLPEILALVDEIGAQRVTAVMVEPVLGSAIDAVSLPFLESLVRECRARDIHVIFDEVTTGAGRTGTMTVSERLPVAPDMLVLGKGLSAGYFPLAALVVATPVFDALADPPLRLGFPNGSTTDGHPLGMAAGLAVLEVLTADGFLAGVRATGRHLADLLTGELAGEPGVGTVVGEGMMLRLNLVHDDGTPWSIRDVYRFRLTCRDHGLLTSYAPGFLPLMPPLTLSRSECAELVDRLRAALRAYRPER